MSRERSLAIDDSFAEREARLVPPFGKGGLGGISGCHAQEKSLPPALYSSSHLRVSFF